MSEPVAWMVKSKRGLIRACWSEPPSEEQLEIARIDCDSVIPLYPQAEIERNRAAIAELVLRLKDCSEVIKYYEKITTMRVNYPTLANARAVIAKYDKKGAV